MRTRRRRHSQLSGCHRQSSSHSISFCLAHLVRKSFVSDDSFGLANLGKMPHILPPLLNRHTQNNNVHIWTCGPAKPPCRLFNIYADMYKYQVLSINERTKHQSRTRKPPKKQQVEKPRGTCIPDQGSGATLGVLGYASA